ncbi:DNRLRE domain-containing protein [Halobacillus andaensis]|uniref:DNRLRE domain-containing protein n=1 Tax=Halobacillus andaensis TaxID=1176239 RepID=UPI001E3BE6EE|nr:DNRLRE domain-containing protein [Halobacillus andaensis]
MKKYFSKSLAVILSFCLVFSLIAPSISLAAPGKSERGQSKKEEVQPDRGELPDKRPDESIELKNQRTEFSTRYYNPDGSFTEEISADPIYYETSGKDNNGKQFKEIDNKLKNHPNKDSKVVNGANKFQSSFGKSTNAGNLVTIEEGDTNLSLTPVDAKNVKGKTNGNKITYEDAFPDADLVYEARGEGVKEDIVLHERPDDHKFRFEVKTGGLEVKEEDGTIYLEKKNGKKAWKMERPFISDANEKDADAVTLELVEEQGKTYVDVVVDEDYLDDPDIKYPLTIDPTISHPDVIQDNYISSAFEDSVFSSNSYTLSGHDDYYEKTRSLTKFFLPSLPSDSKIEEANFQLYQTEQSTNDSTVDLYGIEENWNDEVTWEDRPETADSKEDSVTNNASDEYWSWDITDLTTGWYNGTEANNGVMLQHEDEEELYRKFNSKSNDANGPRLKINYRVDPIGQEDFWMQTDDQVNPANGNLMRQETDLSIPGRGPDTEITRTYNSRKADVSGMFGNGWWSNLDKRIVDEGEGPITFIDEDNTRHIFGNKVGGGYEAAGGLQLDLEKESDGYTITKKDGTEWKFNEDGLLIYSEDTNNNKAEYSYNSDNELTKITDAAGRETTLDYEDGNVQTIEDFDGRTLDYNYSDGELTGASDLEGHTKSYEYGEDSLLQKETDPENHTRSYSYESERLIKIASPMTVDGEEKTSETTYDYDRDEQVTSVTDGEDHRVDYTYNDYRNVVQVKENPLDEDNQAVTTYEYDDQNNLTEVVQPNENEEDSSKAYQYEYDENGNITNNELPESETSAYQYDDQNNQVQAEDYNGNVSSQDYDEQNNQTESTDSNLQSEATRYNETGSVQYQTHPLGAADNLVVNSNFEKEDGDSNWPQQWNQEGEAGFSWSDEARFGEKSIKIEDPSEDAKVVSEKKLEMDPETDVTASGYVKTEDLEGQARLHAVYYNDGEEVATETVGTVQETKDWHRVQAPLQDVPEDANEIQLEMELQEGEGSAYFDGLQVENSSVSSAYNLIENPSFEREGEDEGIPEDWSTTDNVTSDDKMVNDDDYVYTGDQAFRLTGEEDEDKYIKQRINVSGDKDSKLTLSGWSMQEGADPDGGYYNLQVAINYEDGSTDWTNANDFKPEKDGWQHVAAEFDPEQAYESVDVYYYFYDQTGEAYFDGIRLEEGSSRTNYSYDYEGYQTQEEDPLGNKTSFSYDEVGNKTKETKPEGNETEYEYDEKNQLTSVIDARGNETSYTHDDNGNRTSVTDAKGHESTYDYHETDQISSYTNPLDQETKFEYNLNGELTDTNQPNGDQVTEAYNELDRKESISYNGDEKWSFDYDPSGNLTSVSGDTEETYDYDSNDRMTSKQDGKGNETSYKYDSNSNKTSQSVDTSDSSFTLDYDYNKLDQLETISRDGERLADFTYDERRNPAAIDRGNNSHTSLSYDSANRLKEISNDDGNGQTIGAYEYEYDQNGNRTSVETDEGTIEYEYDALDQLKKETLTDGTTITYEYDDAGNRTEKTETKDGDSETVEYAYDEANQLTDKDGQAFDYDENGNLLDNGEHQFVYNEDNRLMEVKDQDGSTIAEYAYDHDGKRTKKVTDEGTINYHYEGNNVQYETNEDNEVIAEYTWDENDQPVTMTKDGETYYYHVNGHGDVTSLTNESGEVVAEYDYDSYGNILDQSGEMAEENPYRYAGYQYDEETDQYYLMARYYDADTGRFITRDTFHGFADESLSVNQYIYTKNNPVMNIDPSGFYTVSIVTVKWAGAIFNTIIGAIVGGGAGAFASFLKRKGAEEAGKIFTKSIRSKLSAWGLNALGASVGTIVTTVLNALDIGTAIARALDKTDAKKNNGWLDVRLW